MALPVGDPPALLWWRRKEETRARERSEVSPLLPAGAGRDGQLYAAASSADSTAAALLVCFFEVKGGVHFCLAREWFCKAGLVLRGAVRLCSEVFVSEPAAVLRRAVGADTRNRVQNTKTNQVLPTAIWHYRRSPHHAINQVMAMMNYRHMPLSCQCGEVPDHIYEVGFSDDHQLVIHWWCSRCRRVVYASKPLSDCWRECPQPDELLETRLRALETLGLASSDESFLRSVGVRVN